MKRIASTDQKVGKCYRDNYDKINWKKKPKKNNITKTGEQK